MTPKKVYIKILIPLLNAYPLNDIKRWVKNVYRQVRLNVSRRRFEKIRGMIPIDIAAYAERKTFGNWRLVAPASAGQISPLQQAIWLVRNSIVPARWGEFRRKFVNLLKLAFNAIIESDYDQKIVDQVNGWINELLMAFVIDRGSPVHLEYVPRPQSARDNSSPESLQVKSRIWERFTGKPLDLMKFIYDPSKPCPSGREMEMYLEFSN